MPETVADAVRFLRGVRAIPAGSDILIAADELSQLATPEEQERRITPSTTCADALKALTGAVEDAVYDHRGLTFVAASAYRAVDPAKGLPEGSKRPIYWMTLPPLSIDDLLKGFFGRLHKINPTLVRRSWPYTHMAQFLRTSQGNPGMPWLPRAAVSLEDTEAKEEYDTLIAADSSPSWNVGDSRIRGG